MPGHRCVSTMNRTAAPPSPYKSIAQIITLPVVSSAKKIAMSPFKMEPAILPKTVHLSSSPVILSNPQRIVASVINNSRTPHHIITSPSDHQGMAWSGKRPHEFRDDYSDSKRCKKGEKGGKGLRHFSMKVCEKVRRKGTTSYNEVADELVAEFSDPHRHMCATDQAYDQKNIRRRVYDALNVLMAMNIISKEKKEIKWLGLPTNSAQEYQNLEKEKQKRIERIRVKTQNLQELIIQQILFKNLAERNNILEHEASVPPPHNKIRMPFVLINTSKETTIDCSISSDRKDFKFGFNDTFQVNDDAAVLKKMGLALNLDKGTSSTAELDKAKTLVPKVFQPYIISLSQGINDLPPGLTLEGNCIKIETDIYSDPSSELHEASSSSSGPGSEYIDIENVIGGGTKSVLSRQSSVGSLSDLHSRPGTSTPSEDYSDDCDSDSMDSNN